MFDFHLTVEQQKLLIDFAMAIVSGAVAGLIAGWAIMRKQMGAQLETDDILKLITLRNSLEEARDELSAFIGMQEYMIKEETSDKGESDEKIREKNNELIYLLFKMPSQIHHIQSERYRRFKIYLLLRLEHTEKFIDSEPAVTIKRFDNLINDLNEAIRRPRGVSNVLKSYWTAAKSLPSLLKNHLSSSERELLIQAGQQLSSLSLAGESHQFVWSLGRSFGLFDDRRAKQYVRAVKKLETKGLIELQGEEYHVTPLGFKKLAALEQDKFD